MKVSLNKCAYNEYFHYDCVHVMESPYRSKLYEELWDIKRQINVKVIY